MAAVEVSTYPGQTLFLGDGYEFAAQLETTPGWRAIGAWGRDGWDLGDWPLVVIGWGNLITHDGPIYSVVTYVEGDITIERYTEEKARLERTDELAEFYWRIGETGPQEILTAYPESELPPEYRGPFSWARLEGEGPAA